MKYDLKSPYFNFRSLREMIERSPKLRDALASPDLADLLEPVTPANPDGDNPPVEAMGYLATDDGRLWARMVIQAEAEEVFGVDAVGPMESAFLALRFAQMPDIEASAQAAQRDAVQLRSALQDLALPLSRGQAPSQRQIAAAVALLTRLDAERADAYQAKAEREAKAERKRSA